MCSTRRVSQRSSVVAARQFFGGRLVGNAVALMVSSGGTSLLGVAFWGVSTHLSSTTVVGRSTAIVAAMMFLSNLAQLSFQSIFERFLPIAGHRARRFVLQAYAISATVSIVLSLAFVQSGLGHHYLPPTWRGHVLFVIAVAMWTLFVLQDSALVGLRKSKIVPIENILFALLKLALLPFLLAVSPTEGIFLAWTAPVVASIVGVNWYLFARAFPRHERGAVSEVALPGVGELVALAGAQYATMIFSVFTPAVVSLIIVRRLGPVANAHYYIPSLFLVGLVLVTWSVVRSFLVEAAHEPHLLGPHARTVVKSLVLVVAPAVIVGIIFAPQLLSVFGTQYATSGTALLRLLLLSLPLTAVTFLYSGFAWFDQRVWAMAMADVFAVVVYFATMLTLLHRLGILAVGVASLVASGAEAVLLLPALIRRYRRAVVLERAPAA